MHYAAQQWVERCVAEHGPWARVLEVGSRNVNGSVREFFEASFVGRGRTVAYLGVDAEAGHGVDIQVDFLALAPETVGGAVFDCLVCCEVLEHAPWRLLVARFGLFLREGGALVLTCAGPGREEHSAVDGGRLRAGEHYGNVDPADLKDELGRAGFVGVEIDTTAPGDVRAYARWKG